MEKFHGETFNEELDGSRLRSQLHIVKSLLSDGCWWTMWNLQAAVGAKLGKRCSESSIGRRVRQLREKECGSRTIETKRANSGGTWLYRMAA